MNFRSSVASVAALAMLATACASGGGSAGPATPSEEGYRPTDNSHTQTAQLFLVQAQQGDTPDPARFQQVLDNANNSIAEDSLNPLGYRLAGEAYVGLNNFAEADRMFDQATELYPAYEEELRFVRETAWVQAYNDAIPPLQDGNLPAAQEAFERANIIYDGRPEAMLQLASIYERSDQTDRAVETYEQLLSLVRGPSLMQQDSATQIAWAEQEEIAAFNIAQTYTRAERFDEAIAAYASYLENNPDNVQVTSNMAGLLAQMGQPDSAQAVYASLMTRTGLTSRESFAIGIGYYNMEVYSEAAAAFKRSLEGNSMSRDAAYNYAQSLFLAEEFDDLANAGQHLIELDPKNPNAYLLAGQGLLRAGQEDEANETANMSEALDFELSDASLQPLMGGGANFSGVVTNKTLDEGTVITLRFHFTLDDGTEASTRDITVQAGAADAEVPFDTEVSAEETVIGFWYEVVRP